MKLKTAALMVATGALHVALAAAVPRDATERLLIHERPFANGVLGYMGNPSLIPSDFDWDLGWNDTNEMAPLHSLHTQCGSNQLHCANNNLASSSVCQSLVNALSSNPNAAIANGVSAIYWTSGSFTCCTAWQGQISNMIQGYIAPAASQILGQCGPTGAVSGWATDVNLNNVCTAQCLSNRCDCVV